LENIEKPNSNPCSGCGKCCFTHPCALAPDDLQKIARHLNLSEQELFNRFLVLDYVDVAGRKQYYLCPARRADKSGTIVKPDWSFSNSPCIFLHGTKCTIQDVKPKGGMEYYCRILTNSDHGFVGYGKKRAASEWARSATLQGFIDLANGKS